MKKIFYGIIITLAFNIYANADQAMPLNKSLGIDLANRDLKMRSQDDFYQYVNGNWLKNTQIPQDKSSWGSFNQLQENTLNQLKNIINSLNHNNSTINNNNPNQQKIINFYNSFMDQKKLDRLEIKPLAQEFQVINNFNDKKQLASMIAKLSILGISTPYDLVIHQDAKNSTVTIADLIQGGLGLPDRDYYLNTNDLKLKSTLNKYQQHITRMLTLSGDSNANVHAAQIVGLEHNLAQIQWTKVENRDPVKTYNKYPLEKLTTLMPHYSWSDYLIQSQLKNKISYVIVSQPSYLIQLDQLIQNVPLNVWRQYFKWHLLSNYAGELSTPFAQENFAFYGTVLRGIPQQAPRWKRAIAVVDGALGEALGQLYVEQYFPVQYKTKIEILVKNITNAYRLSINNVDWMESSTKIHAQEKLSAMMLKIAYPAVWRNYSKLIIKADDLIANQIRANYFEYQRNINKLGQPLDRNEWEMTPQTVNAYYNPELNEIVFPAAILQAPFFNPVADDAVNYGGIGAVIGHELSHAFDDQGSQYDAQGNLNNWWTDQDRVKFKQKTAALVKQYDAYSPIKGYYVNGELTLGENIADNSGLSIAYQAYLISLADKSAPIIDQTTGSQRFYMGWTQVWRAKIREAQLIVYLKTDPHSPAKVRGNATLTNQNGFYDAFDLKVGDKMYLVPAKRVIIW